MLEPRSGLWGLLRQSTLQRRYLRGRKERRRRDFLDRFDPRDVAGSDDCPPQARAGYISGGSVLFARGEPAAGRNHERVAVGCGAGGDMRHGGSFGLRGGLFDTLDRGFGKSSARFGTISAAMTSDWERLRSALTALWLNHRGASIEAIKEQPALMGLNYVGDITKASADGAMPTEHQIARQCQAEIVRACENWVRDAGPPIAETILGVAQGTKGLARRQRRDLVTERYGIPPEVLTHNRKNKSSYENQILDAVTHAIFDREERHNEHGQESVYRRHPFTDFDRIDPDALQVNSYHAELTVSDDDQHSVEIARHLKLQPFIREARNQFIFHDMWASQLHPAGVILYESRARVYGPSSNLRYDGPAALDGSTSGALGVEHRFRTRLDLAEGDIFEVSFTKRYPPLQPGRRWLGFFAGGSTPDVSLTVKIPPTVTEITSCKYGHFGMMSMPGEHRSLDIGATPGRYEHQASLFANESLMLTWVEHH